MAEVAADEVNEAPSSSSSSFLWRWKPRLVKLTMAPFSLLMMTSGTPVMSNELKVVLEAAKERL